MTTTVLVLTLLAVAWAVLLWPRKRTDRSAMREHARAVAALRRATQGER